MSNSQGRAKMVREIRRNMGFVQPEPGQFDMSLKAMLEKEPQAVLVDLLLAIGDESKEDLWIKAGGR